MLKEKSAELRAHQAGYDAGFNHANYVSAYGGELNHEPTFPAKFDEDSSFYLCGYEEGIEDYTSSQLFGEFEDESWPNWMDEDEEPAENDCND